MMSFSDVIDIDAMNKLLYPIRIRIVQNNHGYPLDIMFKAHCMRNSAMFGSLASMIRFTPAAIQNITHFKFQQKNTRMSVIHLRNEIDKFSNENGKNICNEKYIETIRNHIDPTESDVIVLTTNPKHDRVIQWMLQNGYIVHICPKKPIRTRYDKLDDDTVIQRFCAPHDPCDKEQRFRELDAACDLEIGRRYCDHVFIGACNLDLATGSSFSFCLFHMLDAHVKRVVLDLDNLDANVQIYDGLSI
jgi:hypothetical protein